MKNLNNFTVIRKNVLLRVDLNVPVQNGVVSDKTRIFAIKATVDKLRKGNNKIFLLTHFGRPEEKYNKNFSIKFLIKILEDTLFLDKIFFATSCIGDEIQNIKIKMQPGDVCLLENVRFNLGEKLNDIVFSKKLSEPFDIFVNDAFSVSHRNHSSIIGIPNHLPSLAGINLIKEINNLNKFFSSPNKPVSAIIGGAKVSTKLKLLNHLVENLNTIIIGGAMANTFLLAKGIAVGKSLVEEDLVVEANHILNKAINFNTNIILPIDVVCSNSIDDKENVRVIEINKIQTNQMILDIGKQTIKQIKYTLKKSKTILWNGPLGAFEYKPFDYGTNKIVEIIKNDIQKLKITIIAGGGDTIAAIKKNKAEEYFNYISNAGGAFLEWLERKELPGIRALKKNKLT